MSEDDGEAEPASSPAEVTFPTDSDQVVAAHESAAGPITVQVPSVVGGGGDATIEDGGATEPDQVVVESNDGVSSVVTPLSTGFEHDIVFADRDAAQASFTVPFTPGQHSYPTPQTAHQLRNPGIARRQLLRRAAIVMQLAGGRRRAW